MTLTTAILMLLSAMGGAALAVFAMAAFIVGGRSDDFPAAGLTEKSGKKSRHRMAGYIAETTNQIN